jgi:hypothetical protein
MFMGDRVESYDHGSKGQGKARNWNKETWSVLIYKRLLKEKRKQKKTTKGN